MVCCFLFFPSDKPAEVRTKSKSKAAVTEALLAKADNPNEFKTSLLNAPCAAPLCCLAGTSCAFSGLPACYTRRESLQTFGSYPDDYVCCQGYFPKCCCLDFPNMCRGSEAGLCIEGCCFPVMALSMTRLYVMDVRNIRPDPVDYQLIAFSNCMQTLSCICSIAAIFVKELEDFAAILDLIADLVTASVAGCMTAQLHLEASNAKQAVAVATPVGAPTITVDDLDVKEAAPDANVIEREIQMSAS